MSDDVPHLLFTEHSDGRWIMTVRVPGDSERVKGWFSPARICEIIVGSVAPRSARIVAAIAKGLMDEGIECRVVRKGSK